MKWSIKNKVISSLIFGEDEIINPWGVETSDTSAFFSLEDSIGYRYSVTKESEEVTNNKHLYSAHVHMKDGSFLLELEEVIADNKVIRKVRLEVIEDLPLMDFVLRFRFRDSSFDKAEISDRTFTSDDSNLYHQFPSSKVSLSGKKLKAQLKVLEFIAPPKFEQNMYVRSRKGEWIVHARMIPVSSDRNVIKLCSRWFVTRPLPQILSNFLLKIPKVKECLWYRGERNPFKSRVLNIFNPNAFPMIELKRGEILQWQVECEISER